MKDEPLHLKPDQIDQLLASLHDFHRSYGALEQLLDEDREALLLDGFRRFLEHFLEERSEGDEAARTMLDDAMQAAERAGYIANPAAARRHLERLAALEPRLLAPMHGGAWRGDGARVLRELAERLQVLAAADA